LAALSEEQVAVACSGSCGSEEHENRQEKAKKPSSKAETRRKRMMRQFLRVYFYRDQIYQQLESRNKSTVIIRGRINSVGD
jgi:hypothetical protein